MRLAVLIGAAVLGLASPAAARVSVKNGKVAIVTRAGALEALKLSGGKPQVLARCPKTVAGCTIAGVAWSPDGRRIAFLRGGAASATRSRFTLFVADANGRGAKPLAPCGDCAVLYGSAPSWSPNGATIAVASMNGILLVDSRTGMRRRIGSCACRELDPAWSPDGAALAFTRNNVLYTMTPAGKVVHSMPVGTADLGHPSWSPDGKRIAFDGGDIVYSVGADDFGLKVLLFGTAGSGPGVPVWSPDGKRLAYLYTPGSPGAFSAEVWVMNADGTRKRRVYHSACCARVWSPPKWSPDGKLIAFAADSAHGLLLIDPDRNRVRRLSATVGVFAWQPLP